METYMEPLQVSTQSADNERMERDYQRMGTAERQRHHDDLINQGYEWCPECGSVLVWDLPSRRPSGHQRDAMPVICGDCPPITAEDLALTVPAPY
jgi:hypothetical protein